MKKIIFTLTILCCLLISGCKNDLIYIDTSDMPSVNKQPRINSEFEYTPSNDTTVNVVNKGLADTMDKVKKGGEYIYFCTFMV